MKVKGFSLIEFAWILLILGLIIGFAAPAFMRFMERAPELDEQRRAGYNELKFEMKTGRPCPLTKQQKKGIPPGLLKFCPPIPED